MSRGERVVVMWCRDDAFVAHAGRVVWVRWTGVPTSEQLVALAAAHRAASASGDVLLVNEVARFTGPTLVDARIHAAMRELVEAGRTRTRAVAHVVEVPGAIGAVIRAFLGALERLAGDGRASTRCFDDPPEAIAWLDDVASISIASTWRAMERAAAESLAA